jgi:hypothetical protein
MKVLLVCRVTKRLDNVNAKWVYTGSDVIIVLLVALFTVPSVSKIISNFHAY